MAKKIARLEVELAANVAKFTKDMRHVNNNVSKISKNITSSLNAAKGAVSLFLGAFAGFQIAGAVKQTLQFADELGKVADRINITTEALAGLQLGAELSGIDLNQLNDLLVKMEARIGRATIGMGPAAKQLQNLGLSARQLADVQADEAFIRIGNAISKLGTQAEKAAAAQDLFGITGRKIITLLDQGEDGIRSFIKEADELGIAFNRVELSQIENANDSITRLQKVFSGLAMRITIELAPVLDAFTTQVKNSVISFKNFKTFAIDAFEAATHGATLFRNSFVGIKAAFKGVEIVGKAVIAGIVVAWGSMVSSLDALTDSLGKKFNKVVQPIINFLNAAAGSSIGRRLLGLESLDKGLRGMADAVNSMKVDLLPDPEKQKSIANINEFGAALLKDVDQAKGEFDKIINIDWNGSKAQKFFMNIRKQSKEIALEQVKGKVGFVPKVEFDQAANDAEVAAKKAEEAAKKSVKSVTKTVKTELSEMDRLIVNWGDRLTDTLTNAFMTGKLSFKDMINSMISDFARMTIKQSITTPLLQSLVPNFFSQGKIVAGSAGVELSDMPKSLGGTKDFLRPIAPASSAAIKPSIQVIDQRSQSAPDLRIEKVNTNGGQAVRMTIMDTVKDGLLNGNFSRELAFATNRRGS